MTSPPEPQNTDIVTTATGLQYRDLTVGSGALATAGKTVKTLYRGVYRENVGTKLAGEKFDSSADHGNVPFSFSLRSDGGAIVGWIEGVQGMRVGGVRQLTIPAALAYGSAGRGDIPPNADLVFDVTLTEVN